MPSRRSVRAVALALLFVSVASLTGSYAAAAGSDAPIGAVTPTPSAPAAPPTPTPTDTAAAPADSVQRQLNRSDVPTSPVTAADEVTVVATQGFLVSDERAELVALDGDGNVLYHNATYRVYFDVDPVPGTAYTVEYVAARHLVGEACESVGTQRCTRNLVEQVNLSTGETTRVYSELTARVYSARWHDVDRVNGTHLAVADIVDDRVFVVDTRTGNVTWEWRAERAYSRDQGGNEGDWTHVNDVELLDDGRVMVSLRNMDEVVFLRPGEGMNDTWTLGTDEDHSVLYEQHNPDYIPRERGGPAVVVSDSENNRVVEYHRTDGEWGRAWSWRDARLQWPRDADRLPNGHTLVTDTHGDRVLEVDERGEVVWSVTIGMPYESERLGTGDESAGGPAWGTDVAPNATAGNAGSADHGGLEAGEWDAATPTDDPSSRAVLFFKSLVPNVAINGLLYVSPSWVRFMDLLAAAVLVVDLFAWGAVEFRWSGLTLRDLATRARGAGR